MIVNDELSECAGGVLGEAERISLAPGSIKYYASCCRTVVRFCCGRGIERLTERAVDQFLAATDDRLRRGEIGATFRSTLEKSARMMLEFQQTGSVAWRRRRPPSGLSASAAVVLDGFAEFAQPELTPQSVRVVLGEVRQFLGYLDRADRHVGSVTIDDIRGFLVEARLRHASGMGDTVWAIKLLFRFLNRQGLAALEVTGLLAQVGPRRTRALPPFTPEETGRIVAAIDTASPRGKRDYAMIRLALSTGLRCGDIVVLRLNQIDWRRHILGEQLTQRQGFAVVRGPGQGVAPGQQNVVEPSQRGGNWFGDHEVAAQESDRVFHVAFLVSRIRVAVARLGAVVQLERAEQFRFHDFGADPASDAGGIVKDHVPGCGPDVFEHPAQPVADAFSSFAPVRLHEAHVREREGHHQDMQDLPDPGDDRFGLTEVDLHRASRPHQFCEALTSLPVPGSPLLHMALHR